MESAAGDLSNTSIVVVTLETSEVYIIASLSSRCDTQVIYVDPTTGVLSYHGKLGFDIFKSEGEALDYITNGSRWTCKSTTNARAILGYAALGSFGLLLVATKVTASIPNLPGGGCVYTVTESQWIKISLQYPQPQGKAELKNIQELTDLDIDGKHYFCETRDITRPFPSHMALQSPDDEFVWNGWFSSPFKSIGLPQHCVTLLQGFAECRNFEVLGQVEGIVSLIARRSRLHPGTRYLARGLNSCFSTGNEVECEQLIWIPKMTAQSVPFNTYVWRRGTIPIWWGAELKMTAAEAEIYVAERDPYKGSSEYYQRLSKRYDTRDLDVAVGENQKKKAYVPVVCINLLRNGEEKAEYTLVMHFEESLNHIKLNGKLPNTRIHLINYDWHASVKLKGEQETIEGLWRLLKTPTIDISISEGDYIPFGEELKDCIGEIIHVDDVEGAFCLRSHQNGVIRFNCADSLDRTNAASYFGALQVFVEQCRRLGILLQVNDPDEYIAPLPAGWEKKSDVNTGKAYYIDHNTGITTWMHPCPDKPWKRFDMKFDDFKKTTPLSPISQLADLFLAAGDVHATLYAGSKAMHSHILNIFNEESGKFKQFSVAQNVKINLQRRYQNTLMDSSRQKQLEMFLGMRVFKHLPSVSVQPLYVLSRQSGFFLKPVPHMLPSSNDGASLLSFKRKDIAWVCPQAAEVVELFIYLAEPCHVCQLLLTVSHGADDSTYPSAIDVRTGQNLDELKLVLEGASVPQCTNGTNLLIPLSGPLSAEHMVASGAGAHLHDPEMSDLSFLYDFDELEGEIDFLTRIVVVTFHSATLGRSPMTLGEIEVLGVSLPWKGVFSNEGTCARLFEFAKKSKKEPSFCLSNAKPNIATGAPSSSENLSTSVQKDATTNHCVDLLTEDKMLSESISQPVIRTTGHEAGNLFSFLNQAVVEHLGGENDHKSSMPQDGKSQDRRVQQYLNCLKSLAGQHMERKLDFTEAMKLEIERLQLNISAAERTRALISVATDPDTMNPNSLLDESQLEGLLKVANTLAVLGQASLEDKIVGAIGLGNSNNGVIDFWNSTGLGLSCNGGMCQVRAASMPSTFGSSMGSARGESKSVFVCSQCHRKVCEVCCAGKGALLCRSSKEVANYNGVSDQGGSCHPSQVDFSTNHLVVLDSFICKECCSDVVLDALILDYIRVLISMRRSRHSQSAAHKALNQILGSSLRGYFSQRNQSSGQPEVTVLQQVLSGEASLAEFPFGSFLHSVETATDSAPFLSLLAPLDFGSQHSYWKAPTNTKSVEFAIVLGNLSDVTGAILLSSPCGYSEVDAPTVQIWAGNNIQREDRSCVGKWDVNSLIRSSSELYGPESLGGENNTPRHVKLPFRNLVRCRIIWIKLSLQRVGSGSVNFDKDFNLLSLDETPTGQVNRRASVGGTAETDTCIHVKRILIVGRPVKEDIEPVSSESADQMNMRDILEKAPLLKRFKVPIEAERVMRKELVLELCLVPASPSPAGFRLDAFSAITPRTTHSPSSDVDIWDKSVTLLEDRYISPAVLYLQVSVIQEPHELVTAAEYRLPVAKAGTPMYFDFPRQIEARTFSFKLFGNIAAFGDDPAEHDVSGFAAPLASLSKKPATQAFGLSLSNRIKLYYYADPNEVGKWTSFSAI